MRVFCIESSEIEIKGRVCNPAIYAGVWYRSDGISNLGSYLIDGWWFGSKYFITVQEFRDKQLTELGV